MIADTVNNIRDGMWNGPEVLINLQEELGVID